MRKTNFILVKVVGTVTSTKGQIINTDYIKRIYKPDDESDVKLDIEGEDGKSHTIKVKHSMKEMWGKVRGIHL